MSEQDIKAEQVEEMWGEYDYFAKFWILDFYRKRHRNEPFPADVAQYLRNDGEADYQELLEVE